MCPLTVQYVQKPTRLGTFRVGNLLHTLAFFPYSPAAADPHGKVIVAQSQEKNQVSKTDAALLVTGAAVCCRVAE